MQKNEFDIIHLIQKQCALDDSQVLQGIGDDCAIFYKNKKMAYVVSSDCLVEDVHFSLKHTSFFDLGYKSLAVNLSDIAAMLAKPLYALVSLALPSSMTQKHISNFYLGMTSLAKQHNVEIIGGDLSSSSKKIFISITVIGEGIRNKLTLRSGAKNNDCICISGDMGSSALGLEMLTKKTLKEKYCLEKHHKPEPQTDLAQFLQDFGVNSAIDTSDGLLQDLNHILKASQKNACLFYDQIPKVKKFDSLCKSLHLDPVHTLLNGGEDYELLFTLPESQWQSLKNKASQKNFNLSCIGKILPPQPQKKSQQNIILLDAQQKKMKFSIKGFNHFSAKS